jgi:hypothetical protein
MITDPHEVVWTLEDGTLPCPCTLLLSYQNGEADYACRYVCTARYEIPDPSVDAGLLLHPIWRVV